MSAQPEALRLAERLERYDAERSGYAKHCHAAAAELRRLHEVNAELIDALKTIKTDTDGRFSSHIGQDRAFATARAAITKAEGGAA